MTAQIPVACLGGVLALLVTWYSDERVGCGGLISIFGIAVVDEMLLSFYIRGGHRGAQGWRILRRKATKSLG